MMNQGASRAAAALVDQAVRVETPEQLDALWTALEHLSPHRRPVGDRWGNRGLFTAAGGNFDHKLIELVSNMHDAVILGVAVERHGFSVFEETACQLYSTPRSAVDALFGTSNRGDLANLASIELRCGGANRRDRTVVFRDKGIGMSAADIPDALYRVGSSRKDGFYWQMGAFGRGGLTVLPNCYGWVVVTRRRRDCLPEGTCDEVVVSVVRWERVGNRQTETAMYQVTTPWTGDGNVALPPAFDASGVAFEPGTHLAVVGFHADGIAVSRLGDERSLDTVIDTRLFDPPLPVLLTAPALGARAGRVTTLKGLRRRLEDNPRSDRVEGHGELPINFSGETYRLPVAFYLFATGDVGTRRRFVARDHALILCSNGQVHAHWSTVDFRNRTRLPKLADRILVVVDTDNLPLPLRTTLFTADRTDLLRNSDAIRLEEEIVEFLNDWTELWDANSAMVRDAIRRSNAERSTKAVGQKIARVVAFKGQPAQPGVPPSQSKPRVAAPRDLRVDPSELSLPRDTALVRGRTKSIIASIDALDGFIPRRATLTVSCTHLDIDPTAAITIGEVRQGRIRITVAVPIDADSDEASLTVRTSDWIDATGSLRNGLSASMTIRVVDEVPAVAPAAPEPVVEGSGVEATVALLWTSHEQEAGWSAATAGRLEFVEADVLASASDEYANLRGRHEDVPVIKLNEDYTPLKHYSAMRARNVGNEGVARAKDRYAVGLGVHMMFLHAAIRRLGPSAAESTDEMIDQSTAAAARGVLAVLPEYDQLASEAGVADA